MRDPKHGFLMANGSGKWIDGKYVSEQAVNFKYNDKSVYVIWKITFNGEQLESIENINSVADDGSYEKLLLQFLNSILQKVLSNKSDQFFVRNIYKVISGCNLPGEYWLPGFRFAPLFPKDDSTLINAERIVVIDQVVDAIDASHSKEVGKENAVKYSAILSFILDVGLYEPSHLELYFLEKTDSGFEMKRKPTQFIDNSGIKTMPSKGELCKLGEFKNSVQDPHRYFGEYLVCPEETRKIIRGIFNAKSDRRDAFIRCCYLYQLGLNLGRQHPTVHISYMCGAVESIVKSNLAEYGSFSDFMIQYAGDNKWLYDIIYSEVRSAHWHSGSFKMGEHDFDTDFISSPAKHLTFNIVLQAKKAMRAAILNWLFETTKDEFENIK